MIIGKHSKLLPKSANMRLAQAENLTKKWGKYAKIMKKNTKSM